jgi:hypothetical protein
MFFWNVIRTSPSQTSIFDASGHCNIIMASFKMTSTVIGLNIDAPNDKIVVYLEHIRCKRHHPYMRSLEYERTIIG